MQCNASMKVCEMMCVNIRILALFTLFFQGWKRRETFSLRVVHWSLFRCCFLGIECCSPSRFAPTLVWSYYYTGTECYFASAGFLSYRYTVAE